MAKDEELSLNNNEVTGLDQNFNGLHSEENYSDDSSGKIKQLEDEKNKIETELTERLKRLQADFDNFRRRTRQEKEELSLHITEDIISQILPVIDNFERALTSDKNQDAAAILTGIQMIYRQLIGTFDKLGITAIATEGNTFDPMLHEAVMRVADSEQQDGLIIEELQKGYMLKGKVIRPSMVKVVANS